MGDTQISIVHERRTREDRRREIIQAVKEICAQQGIAKLSVTAVTNRVGCTRSLFYHYFSSKEEAVAALLDAMIDEFVDRLRAWNDARVDGDIAGALDEFVALFCSMTLDDDVLPRALVGETAALYTAFIHRVADRTATYICESAVADFSARHRLDIDHVYETFYVLITGLILYVRTHRDASQSLIKDIVASTLHIEGYTKAHAQQAN